MTTDPSDPQPTRKRLTALLAALAMLGGCASSLLPKPQAPPTR